MIKQLYKCFQSWSWGGSVYIYSDPHFEDSDCKLMDSRWPAPAEQIEIINNKVKKNDTLVLLGDIGNPEWISKIKSHYKVLIAGNHDSGLSNYEDYFNETYGGPLFISNKILLSHEPIDLPFGLNIHGHTHGIKGLFDGKNKFNVCSNTINYEPINLGEIIKYGYLKRVDDIHRITIDKASIKKNNNCSFCEYIKIYGEESFCLNPKSDRYLTYVNTEMSCKNIKEFKEKI